MLSRNILPLAVLLSHLTLSCNDSSFNEGQEDKAIVPPVSEDVVEIPVITADTQSTLFSYGSPDQAIDYLFIFDNSVSMNAIIELVQAGFNSSLADGVFPNNSKIGVMTTMIGDPNDLALPHPLLTAYDGMNFEPGFLDLVNGTSINDYKNLVPGQANKWLMDGCNDKWFNPGDVNAVGIPCITAATQSTFSALGGEAGITAYEQLILKHQGQQLFREGALVNVIYVSDTHDPGFPRQELIDNRKNFAQLDELTRSSQNIAGLKFHAMAPATMCAGEQLYDLSYYTLVDEAGGQKADACITNDYGPFIQAMVESSKIAEPRFDIGVPVTEILKVIVNGEEVREFVLQRRPHQPLPS